MLAQLRYTLRSLRRAPTYTIAGILTLALGIGATTGVVSIVDAVLLRALPYRDVAALAMVLEQNSATNGRLPSYLAFTDLRAAVESRSDGPVTGIAFVRGAQALLRNDSRSDGGTGAPGVERIAGAFVSPRFFSLMGSAAFRGRTFLPDEEQAGANRVAVLSYESWQRRYGGDAAAIGRTITLDSIPTTIIGVMPRGFAYPSFAEFWEPIAHIETSDAALQRRGVHVDSRTVVRLRSATDSARAAALLSVVAARLATSYPEDAAGFTRIALAPITNELLGDIKSTLYLLAAAAFLVLLLGCVNVATLSLVRASVRARELAVRVALGATRRRLVGELLGESAVVSLVGGAAGVLLSFAIVRTVRQLVANDLPRANELTIDGRVLGIAMAVSVVALLLAGLAPAWRASRLALSVQLHGGQRGASAGRGDGRLRNALVALQFAFAVVLLVGAGLLAQSFRRLQAVPDGYDRARLLTVQIYPPSPAYARPADAVALYDRLREAVQAVPGVRNVALVNHPPGVGWVVSRVDIPGRTNDPALQDGVLYRTASSDYLRTMGMAMAQGRWFTESDMRAPDASGFVVNETMAKKFWPGATAIGQPITLHRASQGRPDVGQPIAGTVIGVMRDVHSFGRDALPVPEAFVPYTREVWPWITLVASADNPARVARGIRDAIRSVEPNIPVSGENAPGGVEIPASRDTFNRRELALAMVGAFAVAALMLASVGLYGVVAYAVTQRTREVGIRMALGASSSHIARLVLGGALKVVAGGVLLGLAAAMLGTRVITALLFDTAPTDPLTYFAVPIVLAPVALLASWWPARRAVRVQPAIAMRGE